MSKPIAPCKGCENRDITCHTTCEIYKDYEYAKIRYYEERKENVKEIERYKVERNRKRR